MLDKRTAGRCPGQKQPTYEPLHSMAIQVGSTIQWMSCQGNHDEGQYDQGDWGLGLSRENKGTIPVMKRVEPDDILR